MEFDSVEKARMYAVSLGLTETEAAVVAKNWVQREQPMAEVRQGVLDERRRRLDSADSTWAQELPRVTPGDGTMFGTGSAGKK